MSHNLETFFQDMIEKLNIMNEDISKLNFLADICRFFDISHAFIYEYNYTGEFLRKEYFEIINDHPLPEQVDMKKALGFEFLSELCSQKVVICRNDTKKSEFEERLSDIFNLNILIFIPILNQHYELAGFVGIGDRRKKARQENIDIHKACSLLNTLANTVKLEMFQKGIENTEAALSNVLNHLGIDIYVNDYYTHDILYVNKSMAAPYGGIENMMGKKCWQAIFNDKDGQCEFCPQPKLLDEHGNLNKTYQWDYERPFDKSWFRVLSSSFPWTDGRIAHLVASVDITESKRNQMVIESLAQYDYLTGLANRRSLHDDIELFIHDAKKFSGHWYVLFCDLDGFKRINDTMGHEAGDVLLKCIAGDLKKLSTNDLKVYRQGGDEFVVLLKDNDNDDAIKDTIQQLLKIFRTVHTYNGHEMSCGCSIGAAHYPLDANNVKDIFHLADTAMYCVKKEGRGTVRFCHKGKFMTMKDYFSINKKDRKTPDTTPCKVQFWGETPPEKEKNN